MAAVTSYANALQGVPKKPKTIEITIVKIWMPFQAAERNDA
jgi:hypothetical protein